MIKTKLSRDAKAVVEDWKNRIGNRPGMVSDDLQKAVLAACVMKVVIMHAAYAPDRTIKGYADLYFEAKVALMLSDTDTCIETEKLVAEKFGI